MLKKFSKNDWRQVWGLTNTNSQGFTKGTLYMPITTYTTIVLIFALMPVIFFGLIVPRQRIHWKYGNFNTNYSQKTVGIIQRELGACHSQVSDNS